MSGALRASRPAVIAHRGASASAPENTLAAFELAVELGADRIEFDVHLSADGQPVIIHDDTVDRTTDGRGRVRDLTLDQLRRLDAGAWCGERFRSQRLPTVDEVVERFRGRIGFAIELKAGSRVYPGIEDLVVSLLEGYHLVEDALVLSFDPQALAAAARRNPRSRRVLLVDRPKVGGLDAAAAQAQATAVGLSRTLASRQRLHTAREAGLDIYVWTVNDPSAIDELLEADPAGIITDRPDLARACIRARGGG